MSKLNLSNWANIAEIGTSVVVVLSLVYIGFELDQNTKATHANSWQTINALLIDLEIAEASDPELGNLIRTAESNPQELSAEQFWRFSRIAESRIGVFEITYLAIRNETLGDYQWQAMEGYLAFTMCKPGYQQFWEKNGVAVYHPDFVRYVNQVLTTCTASSSQK